MGSNVAMIGAGIRRETGSSAIRHMIGLYMNVRIMLEISHGKDAPISAAVVRPRLPGADQGSGRDDVYFQEEREPPNTPEPYLSLTISCSPLSACL